MWCDNSGVTMCGVTMCGVTTVVIITDPRREIIDAVSADTGSFKI